MLAGLAFLLAACTFNSGPPTVHTDSSGFATLAEKQKFLEHYVNFRRSYRRLDFFINYHNNGGLLPGPSDWYIVIIAEVPAHQLAQWTGGMAPIETRKSIASASYPASESGPLPTFKTDIDFSGVSQWYNGGTASVGIDRKKSVIVYINKSDSTP